jgi:CRISPR-associated exonuclease Cas4
MEHNSDLVAEGKLIHETVHPERSEKYSEIQIGPVKIDYYDRHNRIVYEIKKSNRMEGAHLWQLKYYLLVLKRAGIEGVRGILEYPRLKRREEVDLNSDDEAELEAAMIRIEEIIASEECPPRIEKRYCKSCSYFDLCWSGEEE